MPSILVKRGTEAALLATNPVVASGELIYSTDTSKLKIGDGVSSYSGLPIVGSGIYSLTTHTHTSSDITNFNSSVSGLVSGVYAPLSGATFTGPITATSGNFTTSLQVASTTLTSGNMINLINSANLYLWSTFR